MCLVWSAQVLVCAQCAGTRRCSVRGLLVCRVMGRVQERRDLSTRWQAAAHAASAAAPQRSAASACALHHLQEQRDLSTKLEGSYGEQDVFVPLADQCFKAQASSLVCAVHGQGCRKSHQSSSLVLTPCLLLFCAPSWTSAPTKERPQGQALQWKIDPTDLLRSFQPSVLSSAQVDKYTSEVCPYGFQIERLLIVAVILTPCVLSRWTSTHMRCAPTARPARRRATPPPPWAPGRVWRRTAPAWPSRTARAAGRAPLDRSRWVAACQACMAGERRDSPLGRSACAALAERPTSTLAR